MTPGLQNSAALTLDEYMAGIGVDMLHAGGMKRTEELAEMCGISEGKLVLDAGCGFGRTACRLTKRYGCMVVGVDISDRMIRGAREKVKRERTGNSVSLQVGNVESTAFRDESFDAVISEGTTVLTDKRRAVTEYVRITKSGGHVGLNELSWRRMPPEELIERAVIDLQGVSPLTYQGWTRLLADSGLREIRSRPYKYSSSSWDIISSLGPRALISVGIKYLTNPRMRRRVNQQEALFREYSDYWGYGLYVGRKK